MESSIPYAPLIYLALFRLAIIAVGAISIILGYRLFIKGVFSVEGGGGAGFEANIAGTKFSLKNAAPGTFFALFGIIVISVMLINSPAEVTSSRKINTNGSGQAETSSAAKTSTTEDWVVRGTEDSENKLKLAAQLNDLAWDYHDAAKPKEALSFSRFAVYLAPDNPNFMDTLAEILHAGKDHSEALKYKQKAADLDSKYGKDIQKFKDASSE